VTSVLGRLGCLGGLAHVSLRDERTLTMSRITPCGLTELATSSTGGQVYKDTAVVELEIVLTYRRLEYDEYHSRRPSNNLAPLQKPVDSGGVKTMSSKRREVTQCRHSGQADPDRHSAASRITQLPESFCSRRWSGALAGEFPGQWTEPQLFRLKILSLSEVCLTMPILVEGYACQRPRSCAAAPSTSFECLSC
jgi:hypothetical protein